MRLLIRAVIGIVALVIVLTVARQMGCGTPLGPSADFDAGRDAYSFSNPQDLAPSDDRDVWKLVFGDNDAGWSEYAARFSESGSQGVFSRGLCYGMVGTALSVFGGWNQASDLPGSPKTLHAVLLGTSPRDFGSPVVDHTLRAFVERYHAAQFLADVEAETTSGAAAAYRAIRRAISAGDEKLPILLIYTNDEHGGEPAGHAVLPAGIDDPDENGAARILVWDPNYPDRLRWLPLSTQTWDWSYRFSAGETWTSRRGGMAFVRIQDVVKSLQETPGGDAVEARWDGDAAPTGPDIVPLTIVTGGEATFRSAGGSLGFVKGRLRDTLPDARFVYPDVFASSEASRAFIVPVGDGIRRTVSSSGEKPYRYVVVSRRGGAVLTGTTSGAGADTVSISRGVEDVSLTVRGPERDRSLSLARFVDGQARIMTVNAADAALRKTLTVAAVDQDQAVRVSNGGAALTYTVEFTSLGEPGSFRSETLRLGAGATQTVKAYDWSDIGRSAVELFDGPGAAEGSGTILRDGSHGPAGFPWLPVAVAIAAAVAIAILAGLQAFRRHSNGRESA